MTSLSWDEVFARRLSRNHLIRRAPADRIVEVTRDVCGIQAQVMTAAERGIAARDDSITRNDVKEGLGEFLDGEVTTTFLS